MSDAQEKLEKAEAYRPYELHPEQEQWVKRLAKPGHHPCNGTGITGWCFAGRTAMVCSCVRREAKRLEKALEVIKLKLEEARAQAGSQGVPDGEVREEDRAVQPELGSPVP